MSVSSVSSSGLPGIDIVQAGFRARGLQKKNASESQNNSVPAESKSVAEDAYYRSTLTSEQQWYKDSMKTMLEQARMTQLALKSSLPTENYQVTQKAYDTNRDGIVTQGELNTNQALAAQQLKAYQQQAILSPAQQQDRFNVAANYNIGENMQNNYTSIAGLDGKQGISQKDISALAGLDGNAGGVSGFDFMAATNNANYQEFNNYLNGLEAWAKSEGIYA